MKHFNSYTTLEDLLQKVEDFSPKKKPEDADSQINLFKSTQFQIFMENSPSVVFLLNHHTMGYEYFSRNVKDILGYDVNTFLREGMKFTMSTMHPEHLEIHSRHIYRDVFKTIKEFVVTNEVDQFRFTSTFKVKKSDGKYFWAMQQFKVIETDEEGDPFLTLGFLHDISEVKKDEFIDFVIAKKNNKESVYRTIHAACYSSSNKASVLSKRELEVLYYISKGLSSNDIAEKLHISSHTVSNHRKNMLKKTNCKSSADLLGFAMQKGFIP